MPGACFLEWLDSSKSRGCPCPLSPLPTAQPFLKVPSPQLLQLDKLFPLLGLGLRYDENGTRLPHPRA